MFNFIENLRKINLPFFSSIQTCIDLGSCNTRIALVNKGIALREATALGYNNKTKEYVFFGQEAKSIFGKTPGFINVVKPVINGVVSDFDAEVALIRKMMVKSVSPYLSGFQIIKPSIVALASVPTIATEIEQKATEEVLIKAGVSQVFLIEKPLVIAYGAGFDIFSHKPTFVVDIGGGLVEAAIISGGGIVVQKTLKNAGEHMNKLIYNYIHLKHGIILGEGTCEELKIKLLNFDGQNKILTVRGKSLESGLPKSVRVKSSDIREALVNNLNQIMDMMKELIEVSPPEIINDLLEKGIVLTGEIASVSGIENYFTNELKINVYAVKTPADATINGLIKMAKNEEILRKIKL